MMPKPLTATQLDQVWRPGAILHTFDNTTVFSRYIVKCLTKWQRRIQKDEHLGNGDPTVGGSHSGICTSSEDGAKGIGESSAKWGRAVWTPLENYQTRIVQGKVKVWLVWPIDAKEDDGQRASLTWWQTCQGKPYDYAALVRIWIKSMVMDWSTWPPPFQAWGDRAAGWKWAHWCTEDVRESWLGFKDVFCTENPTPLTTEHRAGLLPAGKGKPITLKVLGG